MLQKCFGFFFILNYKIINLSIINLLFQHNLNTISVILRLLPWTIHRNGGRFWSFTNIRCRSFLPWFFGADIGIQVGKKTKPNMAWLFTFAKIKIIFKHIALFRAHFYIQTLGEMHGISAFTAPFSRELWLRLLSFLVISAICTVLIEFGPLKRNLNDILGFAFVPFDIISNQCT